MIYGLFKPGFILLMHLWLMHLWLMQLWRNCLVIYPPLSEQQCLFNCLIYFPLSTSSGNLTRTMLWLLHLLVYASEQLASARNNMTTFLSWGIQEESKGWHSLGIKPLLELLSYNPTDWVCVMCRDILLCYPQVKSCACMTSQSAYIHVHRQQRTAGILMIFS